MRYFIIVLSFFVVGLAFGQSHSIRNTIVNFAEDRFQVERLAVESSLPEYYRFALFEHLPAGIERKRLEEVGIELLEYYQEGIYLIGMTKPVAAAQLKECGLVSVIVLPPASKMSRKLKERPLPEWAISRDGRIKLVVMGHPGVSLREFYEKLRKKEIEVSLTAKYRPYAEVLLPEGRIEEVAAMPEVNFVGLVSPPAEKEDMTGRGMHRANVLDSEYPGGRKYDGTGVRVLVRDDGAVGPHIDFKGRVNQDSIYGTTHGDMVAGILTGAGNIEPDYKGMATGAELYVRDYNANFTTYTLDLHLNEHVLVTSSSYGDGCNAGYTALTHTIDDQIYNHPTLVHIFSTGNSGGSDCGYGVTGWGNITGGHKQGKNAIACGNLEKDISLAPSSSRGPATDGRIKPDLCAHGAGQMSTDPDNTYSPGGGTSAAAPGVSGVFTQLIHAYRTLNGGSDPKSGLIKACLLNTAIDLGNPGPDFKYGWGEVNGYRAVKILEDHTYLSGQMNQGGSANHLVDVPAGTKQIRFMLYWMDPAAPADASKALINDLDFKVVTPAGDTILPWVLDPTPDVAKLSAPAVHGEDHLNNMEQVSLQNPAPGTYQLLISGTSVPMGPQEYFLMYSPVSQSLFLASPVGGEAFAPGEDVRIFWDAYGVSGSFQLDISYDNGNTWTSLGNTVEKSFLWTVPSGVVTGKALVRVSLGGESAQSLAPFSIMDRPQNLSIDTVCSGYFHATWDPVQGATGYIFYLLGDKYMDSVAVTNTPSIALNISNPFEDFWYSVSAFGPDGVRSERARAVYYAGGLKNCLLNYDLSVTNLQEITGDDLVYCNAVKVPIAAEIKNNGQQTFTTFEVTYQKNGDSPVTNTVTHTLNSGESFIWYSNDSLAFDQNGTHSLWVSVTGANDELVFNDTLKANFDVTILDSQNLPSSLSDDFESMASSYQNWTFTNYGGFGWAFKGIAAGPAGTSTQALWVDNFTNDVQGNSVSITSSHFVKSPQMALDFDYAYTYYSSNYSDTLRITLFPECPAGPPVVLFYKGGDALKTIAGPQTDLWTPSFASDWKHESIPIQTNSSVISVMFEDINGYGNSLYLDNINVHPIYQGIIPAPLIACVGDTFTFSTDIPQDANLTFAWDFDEGKTLGGYGPHEVVYDTAGTKYISLVVTDTSGSQTYNVQVQVAPLPVADFDYSVSGTTVDFTDNSADADTVFWKLDGEMFFPPLDLTPGNYEICLIAINECGSDTLCQNITISGIRNVELPGILLFPNPVREEVFVKNLSGVENFDLSLTDITGRGVLAQKSIELQQGIQPVLNVRHLPSGVYWLRLSNRVKTGIYKLIIAR